MPNTIPKKRRKVEHDPNIVKQLRFPDYTPIPLDAKIRQEIIRNKRNYFLINEDGSETPVYTVNYLTTQRLKFINGTDVPSNAVTRHEGQGSKSRYFVIHDDKSETQVYTIKAQAILRFKDEKGTLFSDKSKIRQEGVGKAANYFGMTDQGEISLYKMSASTNHSFKFANGKSVFPLAVIHPKKEKGKCKYYVKNDDESETPVYKPGAFNKLYMRYADGSKVPLDAKIYQEGKGKHANYFIDGETGRTQIYKPDYYYTMMCFKTREGIEVSVKANIQHEKNDDGVRHYLVDKDGAKTQVYTRAESYQFENSKKRKLLKKEIKDLKEEVKELRENLEKVKDMESEEKLKMSVGLEKYRTEAKALGKENNNIDSCNPLKGISNSGIELKGPNDKHAVDKASTENELTSTINTQAHDWLDLILNVESSQAIDSEDDVILKEELDDEASESEIKRLNISPVTPNKSFNYFSSGISFFNTNPTAQTVPEVIPFKNKIK